MSSSKSWPSSCLQWSMMEPEGLVTVINGDLYFSPNSRRPVSAIPALPQPWKFVERVSTATDFQEARWWSEGSEWLGFVPRQPVPYTGVWFGPLNIIPNKLLCENQKEYGLPAFYSEKWLEIDSMLWETCQVLRDSYHLSYALPFPPRRWGYHKMFSSRREAMRHITEGRDWFAMWLGLLYWSTRKIPNGPDFAEGMTPPDWFKTVVLKRSQNLNGTYVDAIRTSQLLQNWWQIERVGLFLHHPTDAPAQPSAQWFVDQSVPVWYRWGDREGRSSTQRDFNLLRPTPEQLQTATTWLYTSPAPGLSTTNPNSYFPDDDREDGPGEAPGYEFTPLSPTLLSPQLPGLNELGAPSRGPFTVAVTQQQPPLNNAGSSEPTANKPRTFINSKGFPETDYGSGRSVWEDFFRKQQERHRRKLDKETTKQKQARESRLRQPPRTSCPVYVWDWNDDEPPTFVRTRVRNDEREETLNSYSANQLKYNAFDNEWDCCREWGDDPEEEEDPPAKTAEDLLTDRLVTEVRRLLYEYYGWVAPIPLPPPNNSSMSEDDRKSLIAVLGLQTVRTTSPLFDTPLAKSAIPFIKLLAAKEVQRPSLPEWDLSQQNRLSVLNCRSLNFIRRVTRDNATWYMFDLGPQKTVPWNLAVPTAATALLVCRLMDKLDEPTKNRLDETAVARELVLEGVRFHTVVRRDSLGPADPEPPTSTYLPMRLSDHEFNCRDHDFYMFQCKEIMASPHARAALMRGGFARRIALRYMKVSEALRGPCGLYVQRSHMFVAKDANDVEYVDDELSDAEFDMLAGLYYKYTGHAHKLVKLCWYPQCWIFEGCGLDVGRWSEHAEAIWNKRTDAILNDTVKNNLRVPLNVNDWRSKLRGLADARRAWAKVEVWSKELLSERPV